jgi:hypothetical protein
VGREVVVIIGSPSSTHWFDWQTHVLSATLGVPPVAPAYGDRYVIPAGAIGVWAAHVNAVTQWDGDNWEFLAPGVDWTVWSVADGLQRTWNGAAWIVTGGIGILGPFLLRDATNTMTGGPIRWDAVVATPGLSQIALAAGGAGSAFAVAAQASVGGAGVNAGGALNQAAGAATANVGQAAQGGSFNFHGGDVDGLGTNVQGGSGTMRGGAVTAAFTGMGNGGAFNVQGGDCAGPVTKMCFGGNALLAGGAATSAGGVGSVAGGGDATVRGGAAVGGVLANNPGNVYLEQGAIRFLAFSGGLGHMMTWGAALTAVTLVQTARTTPGTGALWTQVAQDSLMPGVGPNVGAQFAGRAGHAQQDGTFAATGGALDWRAGNAALTAGGAVNVLGGTATFAAGDASGVGGAGICQGGDFISRAGNAVNGLQNRGGNYLLASGAGSTVTGNIQLQPGGVTEVTFFEAGVFEWAAGLAAPIFRQAVRAAAGTAAGTRFLAQASTFAGGAPNAGGQMWVVGGYASQDGTQNAAGGEMLLAGGIGLQTAAGAVSTTGGAAALRGGVGTGFGGTGIVAGGNVTVSGGNAINGATNTGGSTFIDTGTGATGNGSVYLAVGGASQLQLMAAGSIFQWMSTVANPAWGQSNNGVAGGAGAIVGNAMTLRAQDVLQDNAGFLNTGASLTVRAGNGLNAGAGGSSAGGHLLLAWGTGATSIGNLVIGTTVVPAFNVMQGGIYVANCAADPAGNPVGGVYDYVSGGVRKVRDPAGNIWPFAKATATADGFESKEGYLNIWGEPGVDVAVAHNAGLGYTDVQTSSAAILSANNTARRFGVEFNLWEEPASLQDFGNALEFRLARLNDATVKLTCLSDAGVLPVSGAVPVTMTGVDVTTGVGWRLVIGADYKATIGLAKDAAIDRKGMSCGWFAGAVRTRSWP